MIKPKPFSVPKELIWQAYKQVKANGGSAGVDKESISEFEVHLKDNLYKLWNRMSSGSYMPPPVREVLIPKKAGGTRTLGVPTVTDRIAQAAVTLILEPVLEPIFHDNSYGYRPKRSAHDAIDITRQRCWQYPWVVEFDIKGLFDNINHQLLMKALTKHCQTSWVLLYIERWLKAPMVQQNGELKERTIGTPQGGVVSPLLANLFMHYVFDTWMQKHLSKVPFCRYADDGLLHCKTLEQAESILKMLEERLSECLLELHPNKSKIVYCKHGRRKESYKNISFTFLGYKFCPRVSKNSAGEQYLNFSAAVSGEAMKAMKRKVKGWRLALRNGSTLGDIAGSINPVLRGWYQYYGKFYKSALRRLWLNVNHYLSKWVMRKYSKYRKHKVKAFSYLATIHKTNPHLFFHWKLGYAPQG